MAEGREKYLLLMLFTPKNQPEQSYCQQRHIFYNINFKPIALDGTQRGIVLKTQSITNQVPNGSSSTFHRHVFSKLPQSYLNSGTADSFCKNSTCQGMQHPVNASVTPEYFLQMVQGCGELGWGAPCNEDDVPFCLGPWMPLGHIQKTSNFL